MASKDKKPSKSRTGGIRTLSDLNRRSADSDSDSDAPQEYYTGGEKRSVLRFLDPILFYVYEFLFSLVLVLVCLNSISFLLFRTDAYN